MLARQNSSVHRDYSLMARPPKYSDEEIIAALRATNGMVYLAAERIGCDPDTIHNRANQKLKVRAVIRCERAKIVDTAERQLARAIQDREPWAIQLALKTIGRERGYVERVEVQDVSDEQVTVEISRELAQLAHRGQTTDALPSPSANGQA